MLLRRPLPRLRPVAAAMLVALALVVGLGAGPTTPTAGAGTPVCKNVNREVGGFPMEVRAGGRPDGRLLGRIWLQVLRSGGSCTVLQAVAYRGTPHYMSIQVCERLVNPLKPSLGGVNCSGTDAGKYSRYAGPIIHREAYCQAIRVRIDVPGGRRLADRWVRGPCN